MLLALRPGSTRTSRSGRRSPRSATPWTLIEADVVRGRRLTSWPSLRADVRNAGGEWVDSELVVDTEGPGPLMSSRKPDDLPAFCDALVKHLG